MELRELALQILSSSSLHDKLATPTHITDHQPGTSIHWSEPERAPDMCFAKHSRKDKLPKPKDLVNHDRRAVCLHRFAGHELLAVEIMAFALLKYTDAPRQLRRAIAHTLMEEQEHVRLYLRALERLGVRFGDFSLYRHFWSYTPFLHTPAHYFSMMSLTFEMANLDFAPMYGSAFAAYGDEASAGLMQRIFQDEIGHVAVGAHYLKMLKPKETNLWDYWIQHQTNRSTPSRARGVFLQKEARLKAGIPQEWIDKFEQIEPEINPKQFHQYAADSRALETMSREK